MRKVYWSLLVIVSTLVAALNPLALPARAAADAAITIKVSTSGVDTPDCVNRNNPDRPVCRNIQYAVEKSQSGDTILVAQGTYMYSGINMGGETALICAGYTIQSATNYPVVCIKDKTLTIRGGYTVSNWNTPSANPALTVIDGQSTHRGISSVSTNPTTPLANLTLENLTIQNGFAQGTTGSRPENVDGRGAGLHTNSTLTLRNVAFKNNRAFGINKGQAAGSSGVGGAMHANNYGTRRTVTLERVLFDNNLAQSGDGSERGGLAFGGAFYLYNILMTATNITMTNNTAQGGNSNGDGQTSDGLWADGMGGGAAIHYLSQVTINGLVASGNRAIGGNAGSSGGNTAGHGWGGAIWAEGRPSEQVQVTINDAQMLNNLAQGGNANVGGYGGGGVMQPFQTEARFNRVRMIGNIARGGNGSGTRGYAEGGAIYVNNLDGASGFNPVLTVINSVIANNSVQLGSGGGAAVGGGGGLYVDGVQVNLTHVTLADNKIASDLGGGVALLVNRYGTPRPGSVTLTNCIIANHADANPSPSITQSAVHVMSGNSVTFNRGMFGNNANDTNLENDPPSSGGAGTFSGMSTLLYTSTPRFISSGEPYYNYRLAKISIAVDQAASTAEALDFEMDSRPYASTADIGADEYLPMTALTAPGNSSARVEWSYNLARLSGGVSSYDLTVACPTGAAAPTGFTCGAPVNVGSLTGYTLTGLSNSFTYQVTIEARNASGASLMTSLTASVTPVNQLIFLPVTLK